MQRLFGAIAIFAGWLSLGIGAMAGLWASEFFGLNHKEGDLPPMSVYGVTAAVVLWVYIAAAVLLTLPMAMAMVAADPRRYLRVIAVAMAGVTVALLPDPLGRAFGLPLLGGAACLWAGSELIHNHTVAMGLAGDSASSPVEALLAAAPSPDPPMDPTPAAAAPAEEPTPMPVAPREIMPTGERGRKSRGSRHICPWCSAAVPAHAHACPDCGATLDAPGADDVLIPGLTEVPPALQRYAANASVGKKRKGLLRMLLDSDDIPTGGSDEPPSEEAALLPPSPELKAEMARLDAEIAGGVVPEAVEAGPAAAGAEAQPGRAPSNRRRRKPRT